MPSLENYSKEAHNKHSANTSTSILASEKKNSTSFFPIFNNRFEFQDEFTFHKKEIQAFRNHQNCIYNVS